VVSGRFLTPLDPLKLSINLVIAPAYVRARHFDPAIQQLQKAVTMDQGFAAA
jgi:hypothetical protein